MLENLIFPFLTGIVTIFLLTTFICLFDDVWDFLSILITCPILWLLGKLVLLIIDKLFIGGK